MDLSERRDSKLARQNTFRGVKVSSSDYSFSGKYFPTVFAGKFAPAKETKVGATAGGVVIVVDIVVFAD